jgi:hypothetical protein
MVVQHSSFSWSLAAILAAFAAASCGSVQTAETVRTDASPPVDAKPPTDDAAAPRDASLDASLDATTDAAAPIACGTRGSPPCPGGTFCYREGNCGEADQSGACVVPPAACPRNYAPVCGCDGRTYGNVCEAQGAGVSVRSLTPCPDADAGAPPPPDAGGVGASCGGFAGLPCARGLFCLLRVGDCVRVGDAMGTCAQPPAVCPGVYAPVCGCNRQTYSNECAAQAASQSVASAGACP